MKRVDALRNRERVVQAAAEVFAERGVDGGVPEIAARAGGGKGTVYRSFPTKGHPLAASPAHRVDWVAGRAAQALAAPDARRAFRELLRDAAEHQARDQ